MGVLATPQKCAVRLPASGKEGEFSFGRTGFEEIEQKEAKEEKGGETGGMIRRVISR